VTDYSSKPDAGGRPPPVDYDYPDAKLDKTGGAHRPPAPRTANRPRIERIMSAKDLFEIEQQRIHGRSRPSAVQVR